MWNMIPRQGTTMFRFNGRAALLVLHMSYAYAPLDNYLAEKKRKAESYRSCVHPGYPRAAWEIRMTDTQSSVHLHVPILPLHCTS